MKVSERHRQVGEQPCDLAEPAESGVCSRTLETAPIATPMTARSTTGASRSRTASGWRRDDHQQGRENGQNENDIEHWVRDPIWRTRRGQSGGLCLAFQAKASPRRPRPQPATVAGRFFGSYGQRSTSTQTPHRGLRAMQTYRPCRISQ